MRNKRGFTIIESLVAIFIALVLTVVVFGNFTNTRRGLSHSENAVNAAIVGKNVLNEARQVGFSDVSELTGSQTVTGAESNRPSYRQYEYHLNVEEINPEKKRLWVDVTWSESGQPRRLVVETLMVDY